MKAIILAILLIQFVPYAYAMGLNGLSWDMCKDAKDCHERFLCMCGNGSNDDCRCLPQNGPSACETEQQCEKGELCIENACASSTADIVTKLGIVNGPKQQSNINNDAAEETFESDNALLTDEPEPMASTEFVQGNRIKKVNIGKQSNGQIDGRPLPVKTPVVMSNGIINEENQQQDDDDDDDEQVDPVAIESVPIEEPTTASLEPSSVCIGIHQLEDFNRKQLVFENHQMATVLCDQKYSCATPGHVVEWKQKAMMMKTYCEKIAKNGCMYKQMQVNSPKYIKALRISSRTKGLRFTPFAARFESVWEEVLLKTVVAIGL